MKRFIIACSIFIAVMVLSGCAGNIAPDPVTPPDDVAELTVARSRTDQTQLWGMYELEFEPESRNLEVIPSRIGMFTANVVQFLNNNPAGLTVQVNDVITDPGISVTVDVDVSIAHPLPGLPEYNGYDVRGVFMSRGTDFLEYGTDLDYAYPGDVTAGSMPCGADGYTRWYNATEFHEPGLFGYTQGKLASFGFVPDATLCPYSYFADGLGPNDDLWEFLTTTDENGVFKSGSTNTRSYVLQFGLPPAGEGIRFAYAVIASWENVDIHPSNAPEPIGVMVEDTSTVWYVDTMNKGGDIRLDFSLFCWNDLPENLYIESGVLSTIHELDSSEMVPVAGGDKYSTWSVEIPADAITHSGDDYYWIIAEYESMTYDNPLGQLNDAIGEPLAAFFRYDLLIYNEPQTGIVCDLILDPSNPPMPYLGPATEFIFDASGSYDLAGGDLTYEWDFDGDENFGDPYDSGTDDKPGKVFSDDYTGDVCVRVSNGTDEEDCCVGVEIDIELLGKNIPLRDGFDAYDIAVDHADGDLLVIYSDGAVYRYTESGDYQDGTYFYTTYEPGMGFIDIAPNSYSVVGGYWSNQSDKLMFFEPTGTKVTDGYIGNECYCDDVVAFTGHTYTNMLGICSNTCPMGTYTRWRFFAPTTYVTYWYANLYGGCGENNIHRDTVVGVECGNSDMYYIYYLEGSGGGCSEYRVQRLYRETGTDIINDPTVSWGGMKSDDIDEGFWDPLDITRDSDNDFYILDILSTGDPCVKKYDETGVSIGTFGSTETIAGEPLRIEGSDYTGPDGNLIFVLHDGTSQDMLSIFYPDEIPD